MELTLTVHVPRRRNQAVDVVVRWAGAQTASALGAALAEHLGHPVPALAASGRPVPPPGLVGHPPLLHGASVTVTGVAGSAPTNPPPVSRAGASGGPVLELAVVGGPDAGRSRELVPPGLVVGRSIADGFVLDDDSLSRRHAELRVDASGVVVTDAGSTNGVLVDGRPADGPTPLDSGSTLVLGTSTLRLRRRPGAGLPVTATGDGRLAVRTVTARPDDEPQIVVEAPRPPPERQRARVPWVAALLPVPVAAVMAMVFGPQLLAFALLGPVLMLGTALGDRLGSGRSHRRALAEHEVATRAFRQRLEGLVAEEVVRLDGERPDASAVLRRAETRLPGLWARSDLTVRLGLGDIPTRVVCSHGTTREPARAPRAPVVVDVSGGLAVAGPARWTAGVLASVVGQLAVQCPPSSLRLAVVGTDPAWEWMARLPHAVTPPGGSGAAVATGGSPPARPSAAEPARRVLVVPCLESAGADLVAAAREAGWVVLLGAGEPELVSGGAGVVVDVWGGTVADGCGRRTLVLDRVGPWWAERVARALAPLVDVGAEDDAGLPERVALLGLLGEDDLTAGDVARRWEEGGGRPRAVVGRTVEGPFVVDLVRDGPHLLVGGTTGSGKSEFLRTFVASSAATLPPEDLALVLVDFKGGAAFGACARLPHVVGLVTDLDAHLVERALTSLDAELRRRERLFAAVGAADLETYRRSVNRPEPLPRLVVVVDELKALVDEVPRFVDGLVRLAALGRSLGIHLVLATQRPSGALSPAVQANVNLRIAFRVRDRPDSVDVVEDPAAAAIHPALPGRALARGGDGRLVPFQAAVVGGPEDPVAPFITVEAPETAREPVAGDRTTPAAHPDAALDRLVGAVADAALMTRRSRPRGPWLPPLPEVVDPLGPDVARGSERAPRVRAGLVDEPELQRTTALGPEDATVTWLLSGSPGTGRTTTARALVLAAASRLGPSELHLHVLAQGGALADLRRLPHCGAAVTITDRRAVRALIAHLSALVARRRAATPSDRDHPPDGAAVLVVVDGWEQLVDATNGPWGDTDADALLTVLRDGASFGVHGIVTGGRALLQPSWSALGATTLLLGRVDPLDAALTGLRTADLPVDPPRGRGVRIGDSREVQVARATATTTTLVAESWPEPQHSPDGRRPWRYVPLPESIARPVPDRPTDGPTAGETHGDGAVAIGLGVTADRGLVAWRWTPARDGPALLVAGPPRSGRTTTLRTIAAAVAGGGRAVVLVSRDRRRGHDAGQAAACRALSPVEVEELVALRRRHPDLTVLVDDADLLDDAPVMPLLREHATLLGRDGGLLVVATSSDALGSRFRGLDVDVARQRFAVLLMPRATDGVALGHPRLPDVPSVPGRGLVVGGGGPPLEVQVYRPADEDRSGAVHLGTTVADALRGEGDERGRQGQRDEAPAEQAQPALDHAAADGEQQDAPDDGRGLRPRRVTQPPTRDHGEPHAEHGDEEGRHDDATGIAALARGELVEVEDGEREEGERLRTDQTGRDAAGAA